MEYCNRLKTRSDRKLLFNSSDQKWVMLLQRLPLVGNEIYIYQLDSAKLKGICYYYLLYNCLFYCWFRLFLLLFLLNSDSLDISNIFGPRNYKNLVRSMQKGIPRTLVFRGSDIKIFSQRGSSSFFLDRQRGMTESSSKGKHSSLSKSQGEAGKYSIVEELDDLLDDDDGEDDLSDGNEKVDHDRSPTDTPGKYLSLIHVSPDYRMDFG